MGQVITEDIKTYILRIGHEAIAFLKDTCIFASTVLATLPMRTASQGESFIKNISIKIIHLPCLSMKHTWGVFSF